MANENEVRFVQIGTETLRDPLTKEVMVDVPLYACLDEVAGFYSKDRDKLLLQVMIDKSKRCIDACKAAGVALL